MKSYATVGAASLFAALTATVVLVSLSTGQSRSGGVDVDPIVSASIPADVFGQDEAKAGSVRFTVSNLHAKTVCLVERGEAETPRSSAFAAGLDCEAVWPGLANARTWTENGDGSVTLTDEKGMQVLIMSAARGFDYATVEPSGVDITWLQLP